MLNKVLGGILLISGTCIGVGTLALPISLAAAGFLPTLFTFLLIWSFMTLAALYTLEANLNAPKNSNFISMATFSLGKFGKNITCLIYIMLLYTLITSYFSSSSDWLRKIIAEQLEITISQEISTTILAIVFGIIIGFGAKAADNINRLLFIGLLTSYGILIYTTTPYIEPSNLQYQDFTAIPPTLSLITTTFGFGIIIPSLNRYLEYSVKQLVITILIGSLIPLIFYLIWIVIAMGVLPLTGEYSLQFLNNHKNNSTDIAYALAHITENPIIKQNASYFSIFAILTSFVGVSLSLFDCLEDSLNLKSSNLNRFWAVCLAYMPPLLILTFHPTSFIKLLSIAGIFVAILLGILPALMSLTLRNKQQNNITVAIGGKKVIYLTITFFTYIIYQAIYMT